MAFLDVTFPEFRFLHGMTKGRVDTSVVFGNSTHEYRIKRNSIDAMVWSWPGRTLLQADSRALQRFYNSVSGSLYSFKFKDPDDCSWDEFELEHHSGTKWKVVSNIGSPIFHGTITDVLLNSVSQGAETITVEDGVPIIDVTGSNSGSTIEITGTFFFAARFTSQISFTSAGFDENDNTTVVDVSDVTLKEVHEYA